MRARNWSTPTDWATVVRRAAGRRHYNNVRQFRALLRRWDLSALLVTLGLGYGARAEAARRLGVSEATISRDIKRLFDEAAERSRCPICGTPVVVPCVARIAGDSPL